MAVVFDEVIVNELSSEGFELKPRFASSVRIQVIDESDNLLVRCKANHTSDTNSLCDIEIFKDSDTALFGANGYCITDNGKTFVLVFSRHHQQQQQRPQPPQTSPPEPDL
ncbi:unnamed protein product, partial [Oppiella nova]